MNSPEKHSVCGGMEIYSFLLVLIDQDGTVYSSCSGCFDVDKWFWVTAYIFNLIVYFFMWRYGLNEMWREGRAKNLSSVMGGDCSSSSSSSTYHELGLNVLIFKRLAAPPHKRDNDFLDDFQSLWTRKKIVCVCVYFPKYCSSSSPYPPENII